MPKIGICRRSAALTAGKVFSFNVYIWQAACPCHPGEFQQMTLRIDRDLRGKLTILRLIGQIRTDDLEGLRAQMEQADGALILDLDELNLVDVGVVRFLGQCESSRVELQNCPLYILEWIKREREKG
jgi:hypothetical protein